MAQADLIKQLPPNMLIPKRMRKKSQRAQQRNRPDVWEMRHVAVTQSGFTYYRPRQAEEQEAPQGRFYAFSSLDLKTVLSRSGRVVLGQHMNVREDLSLSESDVRSQWRQFQVQHCLAILSDRRLVHLDAVRTFEMLWIAKELTQKKALNVFYWPDLPPNSAGSLVTLVPSNSALNSFDPHCHRVQVEMPCNDDSKGIVVWMPYDTRHDEVHGITLFPNRPSAVGLFCRTFHTYLVRLQVAELGTCTRPPMPIAVQNPLSSGFGFGDAVELTHAHFDSMGRIYIKRPHRHRADVDNFQQLVTQQTSETITFDNVSALERPRLTAVRVLELIHNFVAEGEDVLGTRQGEGAALLVDLFSGAYGIQVCSLAGRCLIGRARLPSACELK